MKQLRNLLLSIGLACSLLSLPVHAEEVEEPSTVTISSLEEFMEFVTSCDYDAFSRNTVFSLQADINLSQEEFTGIPVFAGTFEGNGHTISGLRLEAEVSPGGLFGIVTEEATVEHLRVSATITPQGTRSNIGGIAGINNGVLSDCSFMGTVEGNRNTGGIAGINSSTGMILNCSSSGVLYGQTMTGGIAGYNLGVIDGCENSAYVNTDADDSALSADDVSFGFRLDYETMTSEGSGLVRSDTGGIAGYSDGSITLCRNQGTIGYPQFGYNVGGIAGRSDGHILSCVNYGKIYGRKDIGGIVGQAEPYVTANLSASTISQLSSEVNALEYHIHSLETHAREINADFTNRTESLNGYLETAKDALGVMNDNRTTLIDAVDVEGVAQDLKDLEDYDFSTIPNDSLDEDLKDRTESIRDSVRSELDALAEIDLKSAHSDLISSVSGLHEQASVLSQEVSDRADQLTGDANRIAGAVTGIESVLNEALYELAHPEELVQDTSDQNVETVLLGKISWSTNHGEISGALNVGGIAGAMGIEYTADPEDDVSESLDAETKRRYELKCILEADVNDGNVNSVRNNTGGIAGRMDLGLVLSCQSYGTVASTGGDDVGGIVGITAGIVRNNWAKCRISGTDGVGGIVGAGTAGTLAGESSLVDSNASIVEITEYTQSAGAISGTDTGSFTNNVFVSDTLAGINGASFAGRADPISYEELLELPGVPSAFRSFTLRFVAEDVVLKELTFQYGDSFTEDDLPDIPAKDGMYAAYDTTDLTNLHQDTVVTAVYTPNLTALACNEFRANGRSVFYVKGRFDGDSEFTAIPEAHETEQFDTVMESLPRAMISYLKAPGRGLAYDQLEEWRLLIPEDGEDTHELRYLLPDTLSGVYQIYVDTDGEWRRVTTEEIGRYAVFEVSGNEVRVASIAAIPGWWIYALLASVIAVIVMVIIAARTKGQRKATRDAIRKRIAMSKRLRVITACVLVFDVIVLGAGFWFLHSGAANSVRGYQLIKEYSGNRPLAMEGSISAKAGNTVQESNFLLQKDEEGIGVITVEDLSLYYYDHKVYLENGRSFELSSLTPDYGALLEAAASVYETHSISADTEGDSRIYRLTASQEEAETLLSILLAEYAQELPDLKTIDMEVVERNNTLYALNFSAAGVLKDEDKTAYDVKASLTVRNPNDYDLRVPDAVKEAIENEEPSMMVLNQDTIDLLSAWAAFIHSDSASVEVRVTADVDEISLDDTLQYRRAYHHGDPIRSVQKGNLIVYFNDRELCTENGTLTRERTLGNLADSGTLPELFYEISMNSEFDVSSAGVSRVYTMELKETALNQLKSILLNGHADHVLEITSGTLQVTLTNDEISRVTCTLQGNATLLEEVVPIVISVDSVMDIHTEFSIPDKVEAALN